MAIFDLATHPFAFVTVNELADYWRITPQHVLDAIGAGDLEAVEFGAGTCRITTKAALEFEHKARVKTWSRVAQWPGKQRNRE